MRPSLLVISAVLLSIGMNVNEGMYEPRAVGLLAGAVAACVAAVVMGSGVARRKWQARAPVVLLVLGITVQFHALFWGRPGTWKNVDWREPATAVGPLSMTGKLPWPGVVQELRAEQAGLWEKLEGKGAGEAGEILHRIKAIEAHLNVTGLQFFIVLLGALAGLLALTRGKKPWLMPAFLGVFLVMGFWVVARTPRPHIDVFVFQQEASAALLAGRNPYAIDFTNIYGAGSNVYAEELMEGERVKFGFPYTPAGLLMAVPGYAAGGDHRYAQVVALTLAGALLAYSRKGLVAKLGAVLLLSTPRVVMVVECAWTEPFVVLGLAGVVFAACRVPRLAPYLFGLFVALKQYLVFVIPLAPLLLSRNAGKRGLVGFLITAGVVAVVVSAPLILWDLPAFWWSAGVLQFKQPFRADALSFPATVAHWGRPELAVHLAKLAFVVVLPAMLLAVWRLPRTGAGFAAGVALVFLAFFSMNKQAFCNYYFFVLGALCCAVAASGGIAEEVRASEGERAAVDALAELGKTGDGASS